jgi:hypothetical protein
MNMLLHQVRLVLCSFITNNFWRYTNVPVNPMPLTVPFIAGKIWLILKFYVMKVKANIKINVTKTLVSMEDQNFTSYNVKDTIKIKGFFPQTNRLTTCPQIFDSGEL